MDSFSCIQSSVKGLMGGGAHTQRVEGQVWGVRGLMCGRAGRQRWMMDGVDTGGSSPALSRQHKPDLLGWWVGCQPFVYGPPPISHLLYTQKAYISQNNYYLTAFCLSISNSLPFSYSSPTNGILSSQVCSRCTVAQEELLKCQFPSLGKKINITLIVVILNVDNGTCLPDI